MEEITVIDPTVAFYNPDNDLVYVLCDEGDELQVRTEADSVIELDSESHFKQTKSTGDTNISCMPPCSGSMGITISDEDLLKEFLNIDKVR